MKKAIKWLILIIVTMIIFYSSITMAFNRKIDVPINTYTQEELSETYDLLLYEYDTNMVYKTKKEYRKLISDELNLNFFWYREDELGDRYEGQMSLFTRLIIIDPDLSPIKYCITFTHEVMHFKKFSADERYICFETFKWLYEHDNPELHNAAVLYGLYQVQGCYSGEYDCRDCIINYLKEGK